MDWNSNELAAQFDWLQIKTKNTNVNAFFLSSTKIFVSLTNYVAIHKSYQIVAYMNGWDLNRSKI